MRRVWEIVLHPPAIHRRLDTGSMLKAELYVRESAMSLEDLCMFGHHHQPAQAKVLYAEMVFGRWEEEHHDKYEFVLEVHPPTGQAFRAKTTHHFHSFTPHPEVGDTVHVKYDPKSLAVELDLAHDERYDLKGLKHRQQAQRQAEQARRDALLSAPPGTPATSMGGARMTYLDPELQALMDLEEAERRAAQDGQP